MSYSKEKYRSKAQERRHVVYPVEDDRFKPQELTTILYGHARLGIFPPEKFKRLWYKAAIKCLACPKENHCFTPQDLTQILYSHAWMGIHLPAGFKQLWHKAAKT